MHAPGQAQERVMNDLKPLTKEEHASLCAQSSGRDANDALLRALADLDRKDARIRKLEDEIRMMQWAMHA